MERNRYPIDEYALEIFSSDSYFSLNKKLLLKYGPVKAVYICNLIDQYRILKEKGETEDTLFRISHELQEQQTGIIPYSLKECKKFFINENVLEITYKGLPAREWYSINFKLLLSLVYTMKKQDKTLSCQHKEFSHGVYKEFSHDDYNKDLISNIIPLNKKSNKKPKAKERNQQYLPIAEYLSKIIQTTKNINHTSLQLNSWCNDIRQLVEDNNVSVERIYDTLHWYRKNIGAQYTPVIESGKSLKEKFQRLEDASKRKQFKQSTTKPPIYDDGIKYIWDQDKQYYVHCKTGQRYIP